MKYILSTILALTLSFGAFAQNDSKALEAKFKSISSLKESRIEITTSIVRGKLFFNINVDLGKLDIPAFSFPFGQGGSSISVVKDEKTHLKIVLAKSDLQNMRNLKELSFPGDRDFPEYNGAKLKTILGVVQSAAEKEIPFYNDSKKNIIGLLYQEKLITDLFDKVNAYKNSKPILKLLPDLKEVRIPLMTKKYGNLGQIAFITGDGSAKFLGGALLRFDRKKLFEIISALTQEP